MEPVDSPPPPEITPAPVPLPQPIDIGLRRLTLAANHGVLWFGIGAVGVLAGGRARRAAIRGVASLSMASFVSNSLVKPLIGRRRPDLERIQTARRIGYIPWTSSFPSGHSASAAAFAAGAAMELPLSATVLAPLATAVAYSRVHVGCTTNQTPWSGWSSAPGLPCWGRNSGRSNHTVRPVWQWARQLPCREGPV